MKILINILNVLGAVLAIASIITFIGMAIYFIWVDTPPIILLKIFKTSIVSTIIGGVLTCIEYNENDLRL